ncbi:hypothetical protein OSTOST_06323 [Ostertagia ostertagi]
MPRPESYLVDIQKAQSVPDKTRFWQDVASAAESGWDFSTRWFGDKRTIYTIETNNVLPVDLNAFICWNYELLEYFFERIGNQKLGVLEYPGCCSTSMIRDSERAVGFPERFQSFESHDRRRIEEKPKCSDARCGIPTSSKVALGQLQSVEGDASHVGEGQ